MPERYTHKNLRQVADSAPDLEAAEWQESRFATHDLQSTDIGVTHHRFRPGKRQGFAHRHQQAEEFYVVLSGSGRVKLERGHPRSRAARRVSRGPEGASHVGGPVPTVSRCWPLAHASRGDEETIPSDAELVPGWWTD